MGKMPLAQTLTRNLTRFMTLRRINAQRIAERTGIPVSTLSEIKSGLSNPTIATLEKLAKALDVQVFELLVDGEDVRRRVIESYMRQTPEDQPDPRDATAKGVRRRKKTGPDSSSGAPQ